MISYVVRLTTAPGRRDEVLAVLRGLTDAAHDEPGTLYYAFHTVDDDPDVVLSYELFADEDALKAHQRGPAMADAGAKLGGMVTNTEMWRGAPVTGKGLPS